MLPFNSPSPLGLNRFKKETIGWYADGLAFFVWHNSWFEQCSEKQVCFTMNAASQIGCSQQCWRHSSNESTTPWDVNTPAFMPPTKVTFDSILLCGQKLEVLERTFSDASPTTPGSTNGSRHYLYIMLAKCFLIDTF